METSKAAGAHLRYSVLTGDEYIKSALPLANNCPGSTYEQEDVDHCKILFRVEMTTP